uniref:Ubiquitin-like domain-containing protein n=1 Tax=Araucaria cunninghamii TaxID=56994 RepID=A0A0D6R3F8_ARACU
MMRMRMMKKSTVAEGSMEAMSGSAANGADSIDWELRPGGMVVQKRDPTADHLSSLPCSKINIRVVYGSSFHHVSISKHASFGELKKLLASETGLEPQDQKLIFKGKERDAKDFLDLAGVKEKSKIVLMEDPTSREKKYIEMRINAKIEKASRAIAEISLEVDKLAGQVSALEAIISKGKRVAEKDVVDLTEMLMRQLIKLDGIGVDGDAKVQRRIQVRRVQKYVECLDVLKVRNERKKASSQIEQPLVVTTKWETFESTLAPPSAASTKPSWEFFNLE